MDYLVVSYVLIGMNEGLIALYKSCQNLVKTKCPQNVEELWALSSVKNQQRKMLKTDEY